MFDRLVITHPQQADIKGRRVYFLISAMALGFTLSVALIASIFAVDLSLGTANFELVELVAPVQIPPTEPKLPEVAKQREKLKAAPDTVQKPPTRAMNMARVDEAPREVPTAVSTVQNSHKERPANGYFEVGKFDSDPVTTSSSSGRDTSEGTPVDAGLSGNTSTVSKAEETGPPPPPIRPDPPKKTIRQSMGVINGQATSLPKPIYSAAAKAVHASGKVSVRVVIDERGNVISANAVSGHPLLTSSAEAAALNARFSPTLLSGTPIQISGVIVYNFNFSG